MNILIIEDEASNANRLKTLIAKISSHHKVVRVIQTIDEAIEYCSGDCIRSVDVILADISLPDGQSFEIFKAVDIDIPVIYTTAFDEYALKAFKHKGIDYLLKPIIINELAAALRKVENRFMRKCISPATDKFILLAMPKGVSPKKLADVIYFFADEGETSAVLSDGSAGTIDRSLNDLEEAFVGSFFRASRKYLVNLEYISSIQKYDSHRKLLIIDDPYTEILISSERYSELKNKLC